MTRQHKQKANAPSMTLTAAISMGVGAMVGAGIFALMGQAGVAAGNAVYISFFIAGLISLLSGYSYAKLGVRFPSAGGIVEYLAQSFGPGYATGVLSVILYFSVVVVMAMVARAFGSYAAALFSCEGNALCVNLLASGVVVILTTINFLGSDLVGRVEKFIVIIKLSILAVFIAVGAFLIKPELLSLKQGGSTAMGMLSTIAICLLAYHGFGVITNTVEDMPTPYKTLPRSIYGAIAIVMVIYVGAALVVFGNLPLSEIIKAEDYAMAEAARPIFGQLGFTFIAVAALFSAASSINANLYSTANMTYLLAKEGELPDFESRKIWRAGTMGLLTTSVLILLVANFLDLSRIASLGSLVYLIVYSAVHLGHWIKLTPKTGALKKIVAAAFISNFSVLILFGLQIMKTKPMVLLLLLGLVVFSFVIEFYLHVIKQRRIHAAFFTRISAFEFKRKRRLFTEDSK